jgi:hypothetical protein
MGIEFDDFNLLDVYAKTNINKISQKYGGQFTVSFPFTDLKFTDGCRKVQITTGWIEPKSNSDEDMQEEKLLDEQKQI